MCLYILSSLFVLYARRCRKFSSSNQNRFLNTRSSSMHQANVLGFGVGPRMCIGNRFALLETKIVLTHLLSKFTFKPNEKTNIPLRYQKKHMMITAEGGYWISAVPRS